MKEGKRKPFRTAEKITRLIWCDRHCCLCEKACGVDIELAHIEGRDDNRIDNAIPVCYDCHAKMGSYNDLHPRGTKLKPEEVKAHREYVYERHTSKHVPPIHYRIFQKEDPRSEDPKAKVWPYPDVGLTIVNLSDHIGAKMRVSLRGILNGTGVPLGLADGLYTGSKWWNMNPRRIVAGHFEIKNQRLRSISDSDTFEVRCSITLRDRVQREHVLLEDGYVFSPRMKDWYFEP